MNTKSNASLQRDSNGPVWLDLVCKRVSGLRYGVVQIVIHDGRVTQVESTERVRLSSDASVPGD